MRTLEVKSAEVTGVACILFHLGTTQYKRTKTKLAFRGCFSCFLSFDSIRVERRTPATPMRGITFTVSVAVARWRMCFSSYAVVTRSHGL